MAIYLVQEVGIEGPPKRIEAYSPYKAIMEVSGCAMIDCGLPIWRDGYNPRNGTYLRECHMPYGPGRQWIVTMEDGSGVHSN